MREKVIAAARELGLDVAVRALEVPTRTAEQAASALGCQEARIAKSLVFIADGDPIICITGGDRRVDEERLCDALDCAEVRQAAPHEVRAATGFSIGGVSPVGHGLPVVLDEALLEQETVYAAGGDGNSLFEVDPRDLAGCLHARVAPVGV